jgi:hypothetical protein
MHNMKGEINLNISLQCLNVKEHNNARKEEAKFIRHIEKSKMTEVNLLVSNYFKYERIYFFNQNIEINRLDKNT